MHPAASGKAQLEQSVLQTVSQRKGGHTDETDPQTHRHYFTIDSSHPAPHHWGLCHLPDGSGIQALTRGNAGDWRPGEKDAPSGRFFACLIL